jgi:hypothetical protein
LEWIAQQVPHAKVSLRGDYSPPIPAGDCPKGYLNECEKQKSLEIAKRLRLKLV